MNFLLKILVAIGILVFFFQVQNYIATVYQPDYQVEQALKQLDSKADAQKLRETQYWWSGNPLYYINFLTMLFLLIVLFYSDIKQGISKVFGGQCSRCEHSCHQNVQEKDMTNG